MAPFSSKAVTKLFMTHDGNIAAKALITNLKHLNYDFYSYQNSTEQFLVKSQHQYSMIKRNNNSSLSKN